MLFDLVDTSEEGSCLIESNGACLLHFLENSGVLDQNSTLCG